MKKLTCIFVVIFLSLSLTNNAFATVKTNSIKKLNTEVMTVPDNLPEHPSEVKPDDDAIVTENVPAELCGKSSVISGCLIGVLIGALGTPALTFMAAGCGIGAGVFYKYSPKCE